jgi:hypothetical protein
MLKNRATAAVAGNAKVKGDVERRKVTGLCDESQETFH